MSESLISLINCRDVARVGGKAVNLGELMRAGFRVPDGFVIPTDAEDAIDPAKLDAAIRSCYEQMGGGAVAVRSSATNEDSTVASMAGQYDTFLDVQSPEVLLNRVRDCRSAATATRANSYGARKSPAGDPAAIAVIVQRMVRAQVSGVLFTAHPLTGDESKLVIEASRGRGDQVVSGAVQPDTVTIASEDGRVLEAGPGEICLDSQTVWTLWQLGKAIELHFGRPQDIEWALADGVIHVLQARPITVFGSGARSASEQAIRDQLAIALDAGRGPWVRHNISQTLHCPTPLTWGVIQPFLGAAGGMGAMYLRVGYRPAGNPTELIGGQIYTDLSQAPKLFFDDFPFAYDAAQLHADSDASLAAPTSPRGSIRQRLRAVRGLRAVRERVTALAQTLDRELESTTFPSFDEWVRIEGGVQLAMLSNAALVAKWTEWHRSVLDEFAPESLLPALIVGQVQAELVTLLGEHLHDVDAASLARSLAVSGRADLTLLSNHELYEVAHQRGSIEAWITRHGHRGPDEMDLSAPRWREQPEQVERLAQRLAGGPDPLRQHTAHRDAAQVTAERIALRLKRRPGARFAELLDLLDRYLPFREDAKHHLMRGYELLRTLALEMGRRLKIGSDAFYLTPDELLAGMTGRPVPLGTIARRRWQRERDRQLSLPEILDRAWLADSEQQVDAGATQADEVRGFAIAGGVGQGVTYVAESPMDSNVPPEGYVLVCRTTDPAWTPLFVNARGLIVETGGALSHGAILARELGVPAVVVADARRRFPTGTLVRVDGDRGALRMNPQSASTPIAQEKSHRSETDSPSMPPPIGASERRIARWRNGFTAAWLIVIGLALWLPARWPYEQAIGLLDRLLWPLVQGAGPVVATAIFAAGLAVLVTALQWILTDNARLTLARSRANDLRRKQKALSPSDPRQTRWTNAIASVQRRLLGTAMVPVGLLLGPMVLLFVWIPARVDPGIRPPARTGRFIVTAMVNSDWTAPVSLSGQSVLIEPAAAQTVTPIRSTLEQMREEWLSAGGTVSLSPAMDAVGRASHAQMLASLDAYLANPIPPQPLAWVVEAAPDGPGIHTLQLSTAGASPISLRVAVGAGTLPQPTRYEGERDAVQSVEIVYPPKQPRDLIFFQPFAWLQWTWDMGWLGVYLAVYVPTMFLSRRLLGLA